MEGEMKNTLGNTEPSHGQQSLSQTLRPYAETKKEPKLPRTVDGESTEYQ